MHVWFDDAANAMKYTDESGTDSGFGGVGLTNTSPWTKAQVVAAAALTDGATINTDAQESNSFTVTLGGNRTLANPTNLVAGGTYIWRVKQDGSGNRTLAYGNLFKWPGGTTPTLTTTGNAVDLITAFYDGTILCCVFQSDIK